MKLLRFIAVSLAFAAAAVLPAAAVPASPPKQSVASPLAPRFKQVNERIGALFQHRNEPPAPLDPQQNPFRLPGARPAAAAASAAEGAPSRPAEAPAPIDNLAQLQQAAATLKVSGVFEIAGRSHLVINARPYKEGDVVQTQVAGEKVYLRVRAISRRSVTLVLNEAEMTLKY